MVVSANFSWSHQQMKSKGHGVVVSASFMKSLPVWSEGDSSVHFRLPTAEKSEAQERDVASLNPRDVEMLIWALAKARTAAEVGAPWVFLVNETLATRRKKQKTGGAKKDERCFLVAEASLFQAVA